MIGVCGALGGLWSEVFCMARGESVQVSWRVIALGLLRPRLLSIYERTAEFSAKLFLS